MKVEVIESTPNPEEVACRAARNDYMEEYGGDKSFKEVMEGIEPKENISQTIWDSDLRLEYSDKTLKKMCTLVSHLLDHGHFGPFEHPQITFHVEGVSRSLMAQLTRHRHATFDIQSMRYVSFEDETPEPGEAVIEIPELNNTEIHGRNAEFSDGAETLTDNQIILHRNQTYRKAIEHAFKSYQDLLELGVAPENARMVLPIGTKVNIVFSLNARMLMHIGDMRAAADSQWEIREMTEEVLDLAEEWMPITFQHYNEELKNRKNRLAP